MFRLPRAICVALALCACDSGDPRAPVTATPWHASPARPEAADDGGGSDDLAAARAACAFGAGAGTEETLGVTQAQRARIPIQHVIVMMKENRSYDMLFGRLHENGQPDSEPVPADASNLDADGKVVPFSHATTTCVHRDPDHQWNSMHAMVNGGKMDGFVTRAAMTAGGDGHFVMGSYDPSDLPFYYFLANTFAIADRHFPSVRSGTWPNRAYLLLGTSDGVRRTQGGTPDPALPTVFTQLGEHGISWGVYTDDAEPFEGTLGWTVTHPGLSTFDAFLERLADGTLPQVAFVDGIENKEDEHPTADVQFGEAWSRRIYEAARHSPLWPSLVIVWTYDEAGGFFDHVPPGNSCVARPQDAEFFELGVRVPLVMISPWARRHYVSHVQHEHTSVLRFIQTLFDLPALTARDANSDALLDMFDFTSTPEEVAEAPAAGSGGCN